MSDMIDAAFDYRGFVTITRRDDSRLVGYLYDRTPSHVELFDERATERLRIAVADIAGIELTGEDSAAKAQRIWERRRGALESPQTSRYGDWGAAPILIITAMPAELRAIARALGTQVRGETARGTLGGSPVVAVAVGVGGGAAAAIERERPSCVVSCGFAGGLASTLATGDVVIATSVRDEAGELYAAPPSLVRAAGDAATIAFSGELAGATEVCGRAAKHVLARGGALACDLETTAVAHAAVAAGIPWLAVRVVLDPLEVELPAFTRELRADYTRAALRYALRGPRAVVELARLAARARTASGALERAVRTVLPVLATELSA